MDMTYATIPVQNESKGLYSEKMLPYVVSSQTQPDIHHVYAIDMDLGSSIFLNDIYPCSSEIVIPQRDQKEARKLEARRKQVYEGPWKQG